MLGKKTLAAIVAASLSGASFADEREELLKLKNTTINLIDLLVQQGVLDKDKAKGLITAAEEKAAKEAKQQLAREAEAPGAKNKAGQPVRVAYVPDFVKEEIRQQVRAELKDDVVKEVKAHAKEEKWGVPAALPEWVGKVKLSGDLRLRGVEDFFGSDNPEPPFSPYFDFLALNKNGGPTAAFAKGADVPFQNSSIDRFRLRERLRLGLDAEITNDLKAGFRFATSNIRNPVSNNQTLGNTGQSYEFAIDRAFLQYDYHDKKGNDWFSLYGGRIANPWMSTDVLYDPDLSFEGFAGTFRLRFNQDDPDVKSYRAPPAAPNGGRNGINLGPQTPDTVFATLGAFPIQEVNFSSSDKWLFGGQVGADWLVRSDSRLKVAAAYYDYRNVRARYNPGNRRGEVTEIGKFDWTAPEFVQKGNSMTAINDVNTVGSTCGDPAGCLFGLASDFNIFNVTAAYDFAGFGDDKHVMLTADYAKNIGYNADEFKRDFPGSSGFTFYDDTKAKNDAYQVRLDVGKPDVQRFGDWNTFLAYRYVERDAVLDAFTDSVFHLGGTNAKGWVAGVQYGLAKNTWLNFRWFSTDAIDEVRLNGKKQPFAIDTAVLDLNARF